MVEPARGERVTVVTTSVQCMFVRACKRACVRLYVCVRACVCDVPAFLRCVCVRPSRFVRAITCTFVHGFQNNLAQLFSSGNRSVL